MTSNKWPTVKFGDIASFRNGINYGKESFGKGMKVINVRDFKNFTTPNYNGLDEINPEGVVSDKSILEDGDIVLVRSNGNRELIGRSLYIQSLTERVTHSAFSIRARIIDESCLPRFYSYVLRGQIIRKVLTAKGNGTNISNLNQDILSTLDVPKPPFDIQEKISNSLENYDNLIENNNRRITILEDMAQSLYREWFVNFLYPGNVQNEPPLESSDTGWSSKPLGELVDFKRNTIKKGSVPPKTPYMGLEHFPRKSIALENWDEVDEIGSNKLAFERGDILFGKIRPNFHKVGVAQIDGLCSSDTFVLSPVDSDYHALISMVTFSDEFVAQAVQTSQGSKMPRASWDVLKEFPVCIPPQDILAKFNAAVNPVIEQIRVLSLTNRNLKKQRDMLLPKLISGDVEL